MSLLPRRRVARLSLAVVFLPACFAYQPTRPAEVRPKSDVIVRFATSRTVTVTPWEKTVPEHNCEATRLKGRMASIAGDTITLDRLSYWDHATTGIRSCLRGRTIRFGRTPSDQIVVRRFDGANTRGFGILFVLGLAGFIALGVSEL